MVAVYYPGIKERAASTPISSASVDQSGYAN
jgi:hypothetical protein